MRTPSGQELPLLEPALAAELGGKARVMKLSRGAFDTMPLSLITTRRSPTSARCWAAPTSTSSGSGRTS
ncbi:MAG TPA: hypothetical protein VK932_29310 [Kofleriaceae bacterium]|nr:hypothetical protein [Kofleriaceae bacterium]